MRSFEGAAKSALVGFLTMACASCGGPTPDEVAVQKVQDKVAYGLIDPSSAQFRDVFVRDGWVCGQVNGKNRLGAYVGFKPFYGAYVAATEPMGYIYDPDDQVSEAIYGSLYRSQCDENGKPRALEETLKAMDRELP